MKYARLPILFLVLSILALPSQGLAGRFTSLGVDYYGMGRLADAMKAFKKALKKNPRDVEALCYMGKIWKDENHYEKAIAFFTKAYRIDSSCESARDELIKLHMAVARQYRQDGNASDAIAELEKTLKLRIYSLDVIEVLFKFYDIKRKYRETLTLGRILDKDRTSVVGDEDKWGYVYYYLGLAAKKLRDYKMAEEWLLQAINSIREHPNAKACYEQVKLIQRKRLLPIIKRAEAFAKAGKYREALLEYRNALALDSENKLIRENIEKINRNIKLITKRLEAKGLINKANRLMKEGRWVDAREALMEANEKDPTNTDVLVHIKHVESMLRKLKERQEAEAEAKRKAAAEKRAKFARFFDEGERAFKEGEYEKAVEQYRRALAVMPAETVVADRLRICEKKAVLYELFRKGAGLFRRKNYSSALREFLSLEEKDPVFRGVQKYIAKCYFRMQQYEKAERYLKRYLEKFPRDLEALYLLAETYFVQIPDNSLNLGRALDAYMKVRDLESGYENVEERIADLSWRIHRGKYALIAFLIVGGLLGFGYSKIRPGRLKKAFLRELERKSLAKNWEAIKQIYPNMKKHELSVKEEAAARMIFARAFFETDCHSRCIKECQELERHKRLGTKGRLLLARSYFARRTITTDNLDLYMELVAAEPDNNELKTFIGKFCVERRIMNPTTMSLLKSVALQNPSDDNLRALLIRGFLKDGIRGATASSLFRIERERNPNNLDVRAALAEGWLRDGKVQEAIQECEECININLNHRPTHSVLLKAYEKLGKLDELAKTYQAILEHDPHNAVVHHFLNRILHPDGPPSLPPGAEQQKEAQEANWVAQMPVGFAAEKGISPAGRQQVDESGESGGGVRCPHCGREVPAGTYFCACGKPL